MRDTFHHEALYRGQEVLDKLATLRVTLCGAGAVGSNLAHTLVRQGLRHLTVIDFDRIEAHNVGTQAYGLGDVGAFKVEVLQAELFRVAEVEIVAVRQQLTERNVAKLLKGAELVIDGFDNHAARALVTTHCQGSAQPCLHVGLSADYAEVLWNEGYRVPQDAAGEDVCDYPMARNLVSFAVALASEAIVRFVTSGGQQNYSFTLGDLKVNEE